FVVRNRALGVFDGLRRALVSLGGRSHAAVECFAGTLGPGAARGGLKVLLEVVAGSGCVAAVDDVNVLGGHVSVQRGDGRVVPTRDGAAEDLGERGCVEVEDVGRLDVEGDRDRTEDGRQVPCVGTAAALLGARVFVTAKR